MCGQRPTGENHRQRSSALLSARQPRGTSSAQALDGVDHDSVEIDNGYSPIVSGDTDGWTLRQATTQTTIVAGGTNLVTATHYDSLGRTVETRLPGAATTGGNPGSGTATDARTTVTTYYTATGSGACVSAGMAGDVCGVGPAAQPTGELPDVPVTTTSFNMWDRPFVATDKNNAGTTLRITTTTDDPAGRNLTTTVTATTGGRCPSDDPCQ